MSQHTRDTATKRLVAPTTVSTSSLPPSVPGDTHGFLRLEFSQAVVPPAFHSYISALTSDGGIATSAKSNQDIKCVALHLGIQWWGASASSGCEYTLPLPAPSSSSPPLLSSPPLSFPVRTSPIQLGKYLKDARHVTVAVSAVLLDTRKAKSRGESHTSARHGRIAHGIPLPTNMTSTGMGVLFTDGENEEVATVVMERIGTYFIPLADMSSLLSSPPSNAANATTTTGATDATSTAASRVSGGERAESCGVLEVDVSTREAACCIRIPYSLSYSESLLILNRETSPTGALSSPLLSDQTEAAISAPAPHASSNDGGQPGVAEEEAGKAVAIYTHRNAALDAAAHMLTAAPANTSTAAALVPTAGHTNEAGPQRGWPHGGRNDSDSAIYAVGVRSQPSTSIDHMSAAENQDTIGIRGRALATTPSDTSPSKWINPVGPSGILPSLASMELYAKQAGNDTVSGRQQSSDNMGGVGTRLLSSFEINEVVAQHDYADAISRTAVQTGSAHATIGAKRVNLNFDGTAPVASLAASSDAETLQSFTRETVLGFNFDPSGLSTTMPAEMDVAVSRPDENNMSMRSLRSSALSATPTNTSSDVARGHPKSADNSSSIAGHDLKLAVDAEILPEHAKLSNSRQQRSGRLHNLEMQITSAMHDLEEALHLSTQVHERPLKPSSDALKYKPGSRLEALSASAYRSDGWLQTPGWLSHPDADEVAVAQAETSLEQALASNMDAIAITEAIELMLGDCSGAPSRADEHLKEINAILSSALSGPPTEAATGNDAALDAMKRHAINLAKRTNAISIRLNRSMLMPAVVAAAAHDESGMLGGLALLALDAKGKKRNQVQSQMALTDWLHSNCKYSIEFHLPVSQEHGTGNVRFFLSALQACVSASDSRGPAESVTSSVVLELPDYILWDNVLGTASVDCEQLFGTWATAELKCVLYLEPDVAALEQLAVARSGKRSRPKPASADKAPAHRIYIGEAAFPLSTVLMARPPEDSGYAQTEMQGRCNLQYVYRASRTAVSSAGDDVVTVKNSQASRSGMNGEFPSILTVNSRMDSWLSSLDDDTKARIEKFARLRQSVSTHMTAASQATKSPPSTDPSSSDNALRVGFLDLTFTLSARTVTAESHAIRAASVPAHAGPDRAVQGFIGIHTPPQVIPIDRQPTVREYVQSKTIDLRPATHRVLARHHQAIFEAYCLDPSTHLQALLAGNHCAPYAVVLLFQPHPSFVYIALSPPHTTQQRRYMPTPEAKGVVYFSNSPEPHDVIVELGLEGVYTGLWTSPAISRYDRVEESADVISLHQLIGGESTVKIAATVWCGTTTCVIGMCVQDFAAGLIGRWWRHRRSTGIHQALDSCVAHLPVLRTNAHVTLMAPVHPVLDGTEFLPAESAISDHRLAFPHEPVAASEPELQPTDTLMSTTPVFASQPAAVLGDETDARWHANNLDMVHNFQFLLLDTAQALYVRHEVDELQWQFRLRKQSSQDLVLTSSSSDASLNSSVSVNIVAASKSELMDALPNGTLEFGPEGEMDPAVGGVLFLASAPHNRAEILAVMVLPKPLLRSLVNSAQAAGAASHVVTLPIFTASQTPSLQASMWISYQGPLDQVTEPLRSPPCDSAGNVPVNPADTETTPAAHVLGSVDSGQPQSINHPSSPVRLTQGSDVPDDGNFPGTGEAARASGLGMQAADSPAVTPASLLAPPSPITFPVIKVVALVDRLTLFDVGSEQARVCVRLRWPLSPPQLSGYTRANVARVSSALFTRVDWQETIPFFLPFDPNYWAALTGRRYVPKAATMDHVASTHPISHLHQVLQRHAGGQATSIIAEVIATCGVPHGTGDVILGTATIPLDGLLSPTGSSITGAFAVSGENDRPIGHLHLSISIVDDAVCSEALSSDSGEAALPSLGVFAPKVCVRSDEVSIPFSSVATESHFTEPDSRGSSGDAISVPQQANVTMSPTMVQAEENRAASSSARGVEGLSDALSEASSDDENYGALMLRTMSDDLAGDQPLSGNTDEVMYAEVVSSLDAGAMKGVEEGLRHTATERYIDIESPSQTHSSLPSSSPMSPEHDITSLGLPPQAVSSNPHADGTIFPVSPLPSPREGHITSPATTTAAQPVAHIGESDVCAGVAVAGGLTSLTEPNHVESGSFEDSCSTSGPQEDIALAARVSPTDASHTFTAPSSPQYNDSQSLVQALLLADEERIVQTALQQPAQLKPDLVLSDDGRALLEDVSVFDNINSPPVVSAASPFMEGLCEFTAGADSSLPASSRATGEQDLFSRAEKVENNSVVVDARPRRPVLALQHLPASSVEVHVQADVTEVSVAASPAPVKALVHMDKVQLGDFGCAPREDSSLALATGSNTGKPTEPTMPLEPHRLILSVLQSAERLREDAAIPTIAYPTASPQHTQRSDVGVAKGSSFRASHAVVSPSASDVREAAELKALPPHVARMARILRGEC